MSLPAGTAIGPYTIVAPLGAGGMGEVYRAHDATLHRDVAIKLLPDAFASDGDRVARVLREAQVLASLNHPGIAGIYGMESFRGTHALVMELVAGDDLATILERGPLAPEDALPIARQVAAALEAAHEQGVVHRDLKPGNIKVRADGSAKVLDFGLAKAQAPGSAPGREALAATLTSPTLTAQGVLLGTPAYMAPEQARGRAVDKRADIWAFGVVLYEMLTGVCPFREDSVAATLAAVLTKEVDLGAIPETVPASVTALIARCLERDPQVRLRDIGEARVALTSTASAPSVNAARATAVTAPPVVTARGYSRREVIGLAAGGTALFGAGLGSGLWLSRRGGAAPTEPLLVRPLTSSGTVISASISPDGRFLAYVESENGQQSLWVRQVASGQTLRLVPDASVGYWSHTFTPDGNTVVFGRRSNSEIAGGLYAISTLGGTPRRLVDGMDSPPTFSPDGARMAFVRRRTPAPDRSALIVCDAEGGNERILASVKAPDDIANIFFGAPAWSPDGATIATPVSRGGNVRSLATPGARLSLVDVNTGAMRTVGTSDWLHVGQPAWLPGGQALVMVARSTEDASAQVWWLDADTGAARRITAGDSEFRGVSLTADGRTLVSVEATILSSMGVVSSTGGPVRRAGRNKREGLNGIDWMPDGRLLHTAPVGDRFALWTTTPDGATGQALLDPRAGESFSYPAVSANGTVVFVARAQGQLELRLLAPGELRARVVTRDVRADSVCITPDGRTILFTAVLGGESRLFRCAPDGSQRQQLSPLVASAPCMARDGRTVAFVSTDARGFRIILLSLDTGQVVADLPTEPPPTGYQILGLGPEGLLVSATRGDRGNVWLQPLDGSPARKLTNFTEQEIFRFAASPDGASIAVVRGTRVRDAQIITGFVPAI